MGLERTRYRSSGVRGDLGLRGRFLYYAPAATLLPNEPDQLQARTPQPPFCKPLATTGGVSGLQN